MLKQLLILIASAFIAPSAMAVNNTVNGSCIVMDDDDDDYYDDVDDKDENIIAIRRPEVICRNVSRRSADLMIKVWVRNKTNRTVKAVVQVEVEDQNDRKVAFVNDEVTIPAGKAIVSKNVVTVKNPHLHSVEPSYRYEVEAEVEGLRGEDLSRSKGRKFFISHNYGNAHKIDKRAVKVSSQKLKLQKVKM